MYIEIKNNNVLNGVIFIWIWCKFDSMGSSSKVPTIKQLQDEHRNTCNVAHGNQVYRNYVHFSEFDFSPQARFL